MQIMVIRLNSLVRLSMTYWFVSIISIRRKGIQIDMAVIALVQVLSLAGIGLFSWVIK